MLSRALVQAMPSTACNARCPYCYEEGHRILTMNEDVQKATTEYVTSLFGIYERVTLVWFGGEPLLCMDTIEQMSSGIRERLPNDEDRLTQSIITNGALLGTALAEGFFDRCGIRSIQVSMDGFGDDNSQTKGFRGIKGTYSDLIDNINRCLTAGYHVTVRMNLSSTNEESLISLSKDLQRSFNMFDNMHIYPAPLYGIGEIYLDRDMVCDAIHRLRSTINSRFSCKRETRKGCFNSNTYVIQPDGFVVPCEHLFSMENHYLGNVLSSTHMLSIGEMVSTCQSCSNFGICKQGCASMRTDCPTAHDCNGLICWRNV